LSTTNYGDKRIKTFAVCSQLIDNPKANLSFFAFFEPALSYQKSLGYWALFVYPRHSLYLT